MDLVDVAQNTENQARAAALAEALYAPSLRGPGPVWEGNTAYCRECGGVIPERRLKAVPQTGLCIGCAEEMEVRV